MTDCSYWFDRFGALDWSACCRAHDAAYDLGIDKTGADLALFDCVRAIAGWPMALVMFAGVTLGGWLFFRHRKTTRSDPHG